MRMNGDSFAFVFIEQKFAHLLHIRNGDRLDAQQFLGQQKIGKSFLMQRVNFHQNDMGGIMIGDNGAPQQLLVALPIQSAQQILQIRVQAKNFPIGLREHGLVGVERREALELDQLGLKLAGLVPHQPKIHLHEQRVRRLARNSELIWNGGGGSFAVVDAVELLDQLLTIL